MKTILKVLVFGSLILATQATCAMDSIRNYVQSTINTQSNTAIKALYMQCLLNNENNEECEKALIAMHKAKQQAYKNAREAANTNNAVLNSIDETLSTACAHAQSLSVKADLSKQVDITSALAFPLKEATPLAEIGGYNITDKRLAKYLCRFAFSPESIQAVAASIATDATLDHQETLKKLKVSEQYPYIASTIKEVIAPWLVENVVFNAYMNAANAAQGKPCGLYINLTYGG